MRYFDVVVVVVVAPFRFSFFPAVCRRYQVPMLIVSTAEVIFVRLLVGLHNGTEVGKACIILCPAH